MIELAVGTKFYYEGKLCEVSDEECVHCTNCVFADDLASCRMFACEQSMRQDKLGVFAKEVEEPQMEGEQVGAEQLIRELRCLEEKYKNCTWGTLESNGTVTMTNWYQLCRDAANKLEELDKKLKNIKNQ